MSAKGRFFEAALLVPGDTSRMGATQQREKVIQLAANDVSSAWRLASQIGDSWYRAQALAWVAWHAEDSAFSSIIEDALEAALENQDAYRAVASSAWPLRAMVERRRYDNVRKVLPRVLACAPAIANPVSQGDALFLLWQAVFPMGKGAREIVLHDLLRACTRMQSWKGPLLVRDIAQIEGAEDLDAARAIVRDMPDGRHKRQAERLLAAGQFMPPRGFFWKKADRSLRATPRRQE